MQREATLEDEIPTEQIRAGVQLALDLIDAELERQRQPRLTDIEREQIRFDLNRAPLVAVLADDIVIRGRRLWQEKVFARPILIGSGDDVKYFISASAHQTVEGRQGIRELRGVNVGYFLVRPRSYAGRLYAHALRREPERSGVRFIDEYVRFVDEYVNNLLWEQDDLIALHRLFIMHRDLIRAFEFEIDRDKWTTFQTLRLISDRLYDPSTPGYRPGLLNRLRALGIDWNIFDSQLLLAPVDLTTAEQLTEWFLDDLETTARQSEERRFAPESRLARETLDRNELQTGQLSPKCDFWTYEELEHWARWLLHESDVQRLCEILRTQDDLIATLGEIEIDEPCEEIPRDELIDILRRAIRSATKRLLCRLLSTYTTPPAVVRWDSQKWYNLRVLADYLPPDVVATLLRETPESGERYGRRGGVLYRHLPSSLPRESVEVGPASQVVRGLVVDDVSRQVGGLYDGSDDYLHLELATTRPGDPPRFLSKNTHHTRVEQRFGYGVLVLSGLLVVSVVSSNQQSTLRGGEVVVDPEERGTLLPPYRLALMPGDLVLADMVDDEDDETVTDPDARYDVLVLRAGEEGTTWLELSV